MLPQDFTDRMEQMLGNEFSDFLASYGRPRYQSLRINKLKTDMESFLSNAPFSLCKVPWAECGYYYEENDTPGKHPLHEAGVYYIQEPSAMAPAEYLMADAKTERVLDLCAAPGGKSTQIAAAMQGKGILVCNEIHPARAKILSENVERMGIVNAMVTNETPQRLADVFSEYFTRILVDAPCSGEGMFRKNEEAREEWSVSNVNLCALRQDEILDCAASMLVPGGRLVYSTCTFAPEENEGSMFRFLQRHPEFSIEKVSTAEGMSQGVPEWAEYRTAENRTEACVMRINSDSECVCGSGKEEDARDRLCGTAAFRGNDTGQCSREEDVREKLCHTIRLWPHRMEGEGHYLAVLKKAGILHREISGYCKHGMEQGISPKELRTPGKGIVEFEAFAKEILKDTKITFGDGKKTAVLPIGTFPLEGHFLKFGEQLYFVPEGMPSTKGLKVMRPGLHLGTIKKNRFEPSHALALAVSPNRIRHTADLPAADASKESGSPGENKAYVIGREICAYLKGETFSFEGEKGWYLITVDGYGIGWGKLAGSVMKNHYPKGLRKNLG